MPLDVQERKVESIAILDLSGRLVVGDEAAALRGRFVELATANKNNVVLNLKQLAFIDSTGLGVLVAGHSLFVKVGGALKLACLPQRTAELLILTKLTTVFQIFDDERSAVDSFFPDRDVPRFDILEFVKSQQDKKQDSQSTDPEKST